MDPQSPNKPGRANARDVVSELRNRIIAGPWSPGARIPTKLDLCRELGASDGTVQKALDCLTAHGFLHARGRLGTFVVDYPPHLFRIGLVIDFPSWASIWSNALTASAKQLAEKEHRWLYVYSDCRSYQGTKTSALQELEDDIGQSRLAGLVLVCDPDSLGGSPALQKPGLAIVKLGRPFPGHQFPTIQFQLAHPRAMQYLQKQGRQRLAIITTINFRNAIESILQCARDHGLTTTRAWIHYLDPRVPHPARTVAELLMSLPAGQRPDALYITDDHLVSEATAGVADAGVQAPGEVTIVAHANFPAIQPIAVPVTYLGYDTAVVLRAALEILDRKIAGQKVAEVNWLDPVFDHERTGTRG